MTLELSTNDLRTDPRSSGSYDTYFSGSDHSNQQTYQEQYSPRETEHYSANAAGYGSTSPSWNSNYGQSSTHAYQTNASYSTQQNSSGQIQNSNAWNQAQLPNSSNPLYSSYSTQQNSVAPSQQTPASQAPSLAAQLSTTTSLLPSPQNTLNDGKIQCRGAIL